MRKHSKKDRCESDCYKNISVKGYLCNKEREQRDRRNWCKISVDDFLKYKKSKADPFHDSSGYFYFDYITADEERKCYNKIGDVMNCQLTRDTKILVNVIFPRYLLSFIGLCGSVYFRPSTLEVATLLSRQLDEQYLNEKLILAGLDDYSLIQRGISQYADLLESKGLDRSIRNTLINNLNKELEKVGTHSGSSKKKIIGSYLKKVLGGVKEYSNSNSTINQNGLIDFLITNIEDEDIMEVLKGANNIVDDGGQFYEWATTHLNSYIRFSSHNYVRGMPTNPDRYPHLGVSADFVGDNYLHMLIGIAEESGKKYTWFQMEGSPMAPGANKLEVLQNLIYSTQPEMLHAFIDHCIDWVAYTQSGTGIGSFGSSTIIDTQPQLLYIEGFSRNTSETPSFENFHPIADLDEYRLELTNSDMKMTYSNPQSRVQMRPSAPMFTPYLSMLSAYKPLQIGFGRRTRKKR